MRLVSLYTLLISSTYAYSTLSESTNEIFKRDPQRKRQGKKGSGFPKAIKRIAKKNKVKKNVAFKKATKQNVAKKAGKNQKGVNRAVKQKNGRKNVKQNGGKAVNKAVKKGAAKAVDASELPNGIKALVPITPNGFCATKVGKRGVKAADGTQFKQGGVTCSSNPMGLIPNVNRMLSTLIVQPQDGGTIDAAAENVIKIDNANLVSGFFSEANTQYYLAPQTFDNNVVQGHQHITIQKLNGNNVLDPKVFGFFKGINEAATDGQGRSLQAVMPAGTLKENGAYRICSITGSDTHQPILSPVQERGPQDDCIRVTVTGAVGGQNIQVADDNAQNQKVTVNDKNTGLDASGNKNGAKRGQVKAVKKNNNGGKQVAQKKANKQAVQRNAQKKGGQQAAQKNAKKQAVKRNAQKNGAKQAAQKNVKKQAAKKNVQKNGAKQTVKNAGVKRVAAKKTVGTKRARNAKKQAKKQ